MKNMNVETVLPSATHCLCDAEQQEMCNPNGSSQLQVSTLAMLTVATLMFLF